MRRARTTAQTERSRQRRLSRKKTVSSSKPSLIGNFSWDSPLLTAVKAKKLGAYHPKVGIARCEKRIWDKLDTITQLLTELPHVKTSKADTGDVHYLCSVDVRLDECIRQLKGFHKRRGK